MKAIILLGPVDIGNIRGILFRQRLQSLNSALLKNKGQAKNSALSDKGNKLGILLYPRKITF